MDHTYENEKRSVIYVEPVSVEDRPLPLRWRAWEAAKRGVCAAYAKVRRSGALRTAARLAVMLLTLAVSPVLLLMLLSGFGRRTRRAAWPAY